jgi:hypothetical protein
MPRRLKVSTREMGFVELFIVYSKGGVWEPEWRALQGTEIAALFATFPKAILDHVLWGYSRPFVDALGRPPDGTLRKVPHPLCHNRIGCTFHDAKDCHARGKNLPHCYQPEGLPSDEARSLANDAVRMWRDGVYMAAVEEPADAG